MKFELFEFQAEDVDKLKSKKSRLCGNDPGTGKTYVGLALDQLNRNGDGHPKVPVEKNMKTLIVAPKSVMSTWDEHCMELTEDYIYMIDTKKQPKRARELFLKDLLDKRKGGYFITNWDSLRLLEPEINKKGIVFFHIIADEVHRAKNRRAQSTRALKRLKTWYKTGLSGTPADNRPGDIWSILEWLWPSYYTSEQQFQKAYLLKEKTEEGYSKIVGVNPDTIPYLRKEMAPWYTRRRKEDVLKDLPNKYYTRIWVDLSPEQRAAYDQMRKTMVAWVQEHEEELESPLVAQVAVAQLTRLQQFADGYMVPRRDENGNHMYTWKWPKIGVVAEILGKRKITPQEYREYKKEFAPTLDNPDMPMEGGAEKKFLYVMTDPSSKLDALMDLLADRLGYDKEGKTWNGDQIIVFSQSKQAIHLLQKRLEAHKIPHGIYTGDVSEEKRTTIRHRFQSGDLRVFAGTIKAGGVGLTLTASSTVVFIDRDWSPSTNGQAEDRAHRIGQLEAVKVIDLMARNTVDLGKKQQLSLKAKHLQMLLGDNVDQLTLGLELEKEEQSETIQSILQYTEEDDVA
jgi:SNF2 family DNA or RNA helicase